LRRRAARLGADAVIQARFDQMGGAAGTEPDPPVLCDNYAAGGSGQFLP